MLPSLKLESFGTPLTRHYQYLYREKGNGKVYTYGKTIGLYNLYSIDIYIYTCEAVRNKKEIITK